MSVEVAALTDVFESMLAGYEPVVAGEHFIPELSDAWGVGATLDELVDEDYPDLFADRLDDQERRRLLQVVLDEIDAELAYDGGSVRQVDEPWTRPGNEIWADAEYDNEIAFRPRPHRWEAFVHDIRQRQRFVRDGRGDATDPASYLTAELLERLARPIKQGQQLYRAVQGGVSSDGAVREPHPVSRMRGPRPEHCRHGGRVNPPGIPMLYLASTPETAIAEVRPFKRASVSVATFAAVRDLRLVDFSPRKAWRDEPDEVSLDLESLDLADVLNTIGFEMAEPVDPDASEIAYVPTQYVAEIVRAAGFDGVAFKSALGNGTNIVLFDLDAAAITDRKLYRVTDISYQTEVRPNTV